LLLQIVNLEIRGEIPRLSRLFGFYLRRNERKYASLKNEALLCPVGKEDNDEEELSLLQCLI
jgi:hypothetical protein